MATTAVLIPVEEYLRTTWRPDCDYIDGEVLERNVGEKPHSVLQGFLYLLFRTKQSEWKMQALTEQRVQVGPRRFRVPDLTVVGRGNGEPRIVRTAPLICVEILSSEDRISRIRERVADYHRMGVGVTWVVDPWRRQAFQSDVEGVLVEQGERLNLPGTAAEVSVAALFAELDMQEQWMVPEE